MLLKGVSIMGNTYETTENGALISKKRKGRPENLRPWPKGVSGNPGGRPRGIFCEVALRQLRKRAESGESKLIELIDAQIDKAIHKRDTRAAEFLRDSVDGRPTANDDSSQIGGGGVTIIWNGNIPPWALPPTVEQVPKGESDDHSSGAVTDVVRK
jgi:hypothetical protein